MSQGFVFHQQFTVDSAERSCFPRTCYLLATSYKWHISGFLLVAWIQGLRIMHQSLLLLGNVVSNSAYLTGNVSHTCYQERSQAMRVVYQLVPLYVVIYSCHLLPSSTLQGLFNRDKPIGDQSSVARAPSGVIITTFDCSLKEQLGLGNQSCPYSDTAQPHRNTFKKSQPYLRM